MFESGWVPPNWFQVFPKLLKDTGNIWIPAITSQMILCLSIMPDVLSVFPVFLSRSTLLSLLFNNMCWFLSEGENTEPSSTSLLKVAQNYKSKWWQGYCSMISSSCFQNNFMIKLICILVPVKSINREAGQNMALPLNL